MQAKEDLRDATDNEQFLGLRSLGVHGTEDNLEDYHNRLQEFNNSAINKQNQKDGLQEQNEGDVYLGLRSLGIHTQSEETNLDQQRRYQNYQLTSKNNSRAGSSRGPRKNDSNTANQSRARDQPSSSNAQNGRSNNRIQTQNESYLDKSRRLAKTQSELKDQELQKAQARTKQQNRPQDNRTYQRAQSELQQPQDFHNNGDGHLSNDRLQNISNEYLLGLRALGVRTQTEDTRQDMERREQNRQNTLNHNQNRDQQVHQNIQQNNQPSRRGQNAEEDRLIGLRSMGIRTQTEDTNAEMQQREWNQFNSQNQNTQESALRLQNKQSNRNNARINADEERLLGLRSLGIRTQTEDTLADLQQREREYLNTRDQQLAPLRGDQQSIQQQERMDFKGLKMGTQTYFNSCHHQQKLMQQNTKNKRQLQTDQDSKNRGGNAEQEQLLGLRSLGIRTQTEDTVADQEQRERNYISSQPKFSSFKMNDLQTLNKPQAQQNAGNAQPQNTKTQAKKLQGRTQQASKNQAKNIIQNAGNKIKKQGRNLNQRKQNTNSEQNSGLYLGLRSLGIHTNTEDTQRDYENRERNQKGNYRLNQKAKDANSNQQVKQLQARVTHLQNKYDDIHNKLDQVYLGLRALGIHTNNDDTLEDLAKRDQNYKATRDPNAQNLQQQEKDGNLGKEKQYLDQDEVYLGLRELGIHTQTEDTDQDFGNRSRYYKQNLPSINENSQTQFENNSMWAPSNIQNSDISMHNLDDNTYLGLRTLGVHTQSEDTELDMANRERNFYNNKQFTNNKEGGRQQQKNHSSKNQSRTKNKNEDKGFLGLRLLGIRTKSEDTRHDMAARDNNLRQQQKNTLRLPNYVQQIRNMTNSINNAHEKKQQKDNFLGLRGLGVRTQTEDTEQDMGQRTKNYLESFKSARPFTNIMQEYRNKFQDRRKLTPEERDNAKFLGLRSLGIRTQSQDTKMDMDKYETERNKDKSGFSKVLKELKQLNSKFANQKTKDANFKQDADRIRQSNQNQQVNATQQKLNQQQEIAKNQEQKLDNAKQVQAQLGNIKEKTDNRLQERELPIQKQQINDVNQGRVNPNQTPKQQYLNEKNDKLQSNDIRTEKRQSEQNQQTGSARTSLQANEQINQNAQAASKPKSLSSFSKGPLSLLSFKSKNPAKQQQSKSSLLSFNKKKNQFNTVKNDAFEEEMGQKDMQRQKSPSFSQRFSLTFRKNQKALACMQPEVSQN